MHDVHRDSLIHKKAVRKRVKTQNHNALDNGGHLHEHDHSHINHTHAQEHHHDHDIPHGHDHTHDDSAYERHDSDLHIHSHDHEEHKIPEDRAYAHMHEHGHHLYHQHHHTHHPEHTTLVHKIFKDPLKDWFAAALIGLLIITGHYEWLPGYLSEGVIICAAIIAIFPIFKNALFDCIARRRLNFELILAVMLFSGLFMGYCLEIAIISLLLLVGSFMRLNFSWK